MRMSTCCPPALSDSVPSRWGPDMAHQGCGWRPSPCLRGLRAVGNPRRVLCFSSHLTTHCWCWLELRGRINMIGSSGRDSDPPPAAPPSLLLREALISSIRRRLAVRGPLFNFSLLISAQ